MDLRRSPTPLSLEAAVASLFERMRTTARDEPIIPTEGPLISSNTNTIALRPKTELDHSSKTHPGDGKQQEACGCGNIGRDSKSNSQSEDDDAEGDNSTIVREDVSESEDDNTESESSTTEREHISESLSQWNSSEHAASTDQDERLDEKLMSRPPSPIHPRAAHVVLSWVANTPFMGNLDYAFGDRETMKLCSFFSATTSNFSGSDSTVVLDCHAALAANLSKERSNGEAFRPSPSFPIWTPYNHPTHHALSPRRSRITHEQCRQPLLAAEDSPRFGSKYLPVPWAKLSP